jgi:hypothetical protein
MAVPSPSVGSGRHNVLRGGDKLIEPIDRWIVRIFDPNR